ncbi:hypothetical protein COL5a_008631 [Colletotrichum fioriniae]|nr:hypothetical protein COL5a_008631 [Colletotrichum fioriniae]
MLAEDGFDDFIEQKGQGLVLLLSGDTGVGKTLTAEVGTLIITTNRATVIDEAIKSRIHINIRLPGLTSEARKSLWENLLKENSIKHGLVEANFQSLAEVDINGREIKNALKSGILMARKVKEPVLMTQLRVVLDILTASKTI